MTPPDGNVRPESPVAEHPPERELIVHSEAETDDLGRRLAEAVEANLVVALVGDLGAGKTRLVRAVATGLGADPSAVNSPTFVLIQRYDARLPVFHFDTYRLRDADEFADLGPEEYFAADGACFVEWADRVADSLPNDHLRIEITATGPTERSIRFVATGPRSRRVLHRLEAAPESPPPPGEG